MTWCGVEGPWPCEPNMFKSFQNLLFVVMKFSKFIVHDDGSYRSFFVSVTFACLMYPLVLIPDLFHFNEISRLMCES